jgi:hypothetical protein
MKKQVFISFPLFLFFLTLLPISLEARKKNPEPEFTSDLTGVQPYPHQWIESNGKKGVSLIGQAYRPRRDLFVMELNAFPDGQTEIKSVTLKTPDGKVVEGKIRRLPASFMPTARKNYQNPEMSDTNSAPQKIERPSGGISG